MVGAERRAARLRRAPKPRLGPCPVAGVAVEAGEIVEGARGYGMLRAEPRLPDGQRAGVERLGGGPGAGAAADRAQRVEAVGHQRMLRAQAALEGFEDRELFGAGRVEPALREMDTGEFVAGLRRLQRGGGAQRFADGEGAPRARLGGAEAAALPVDPAEREQAVGDRRRVGAGQRLARGECLFVQRRRLVEAARASRASTPG